MDNLRAFLVVNPRSGNGSVERRWDAIAGTVREAFGAFDHGFTAGPGDATRLAAQAIRDGFELVVALGGKISFLLATARAARRYRNQRVRVALDGGPPMELTINNVAVANGRYFGGGMHIAPMAKIDDGLFEVVALGDFGAGEIALKIRHLYKGTHIGMPKVQHFQARHLEAVPVEADARVLLDVDGEQPGSLPSTFDVLPGAIAFKIPS
jgi:diacylglycerol kinase family enzyme